MDIKRYDFEHRIAEVMPMLEEHYLYGTKSLIRDLKRVVDEIEEIRNEVIDEFTSTLIPRLTDAIYPQDVASMTNLINDVVEELKGRCRMSKAEQIEKLLMAYKEVEEDIKVLQSNIDKAREYLSKDTDDIDADYFDEHYDIEEGLNHIRMF